MSDPEAESKNVHQENRPAVTKREPKRTGRGMGCLGGVITYLVLGGLTTLIYASSDAVGIHGWWRGYGGGDWWHLPGVIFSLFYGLTWPIAGLALLIAFINSLVDWMRYGMPWRFKKK